jgi:hypothetical protein
MFLAPSIASTKFAEFISKEIPRVQDNPQIWSALLAVSGISRPQNGKSIPVGIAGILLARSALIFGTPPQVVPISIKTPNECAGFDPKTPDVIYIGEDFIKRFEKDYPHEPACKFMLASVLHELVHFLDFKKDGSLQDADILPNGVKDKLWVKITGMDQGHIFEMAAFGNIARDWEPLYP